MMAVWIWRDGGMELWNVGIMENVESRLNRDEILQSGRIWEMNPGTKVRKSKK